MPWQESERARKRSCICVFASFCKVCYLDFGIILTAVIFFHFIRKRSVKTITWQFSVLVLYLYNWSQIEQFTTFKITQPLFIRNPPRLSWYNVLYLYFSSLIVNLFWRLYNKNMYGFIRTIRLNRQWWLCIPLYSLH